MTHSEEQKHTTIKRGGDSLILFLQAYVQVALVAANTYFISHKTTWGIAVASFLISYIWTHNVKRIAVSTEYLRIVYSTGACLGGLTGYFIASLL